MLARKQPSSFCEEPIDFVIPWVDGGDREWLKEKAEFDSSSSKNETNCDARYRDWGLLRYWFRSIEEYAPWVRRVHFVTWGHVPEWLNLDNPKLNVVKHSDYIPENFLPTYSSHVIELNFHRIEGLAERFVYFNDDMFLLRSVRPSDFFDEGCPRDIAALNVHCCELDMPIQMISCKDTAVVNSHFDVKASIRENRVKWFCLEYGATLLRTLLLMPWPRFPGFYMPHCPQSLLKNTFEEVWNAEPEVLSETCSHKFRCENDVNQWVMRCWQIAKGNFVPRPASFSVSYMFADEDKRGVAAAIERELAKPKAKAVCINDADMDEGLFAECRDRVLRAFEARFPKKCSFEIGGAC